MPFEWSPAKNAELKSHYGFGFEQMIVAIAEGVVLDLREHPNKAKYAHQRQYVLNLDGYAWVMPFVVDEEWVFLKTFFPSRAATKEYLG